jgi:porphobilinogen synthase
MSPRPGFPRVRPRRLRRTPALRRLVAETTVSPENLIAPLFVKEGIMEPWPVPSLPGVWQHSRDSLRAAAAEAVAVGVGALLLFGIPAAKDGIGSGADAADGVVQAALGDLSADLGDATVLIADLCLCEYTDHGHCGPLTLSGDVDNDAALTRYGSVAASLTAAGAHVVAPSGMMDGQVAAVRAALDSAGYAETVIMSYAAKFASAFYGPFRDAAESAPALGDRRGYQMDPGASDQALREVALDIAEGADAVIVKPAMPYLDVINRVAAEVEVPVVAYQVSGEYAMVEAAAARGWLDRERVMHEMLLGARRAGADAVITYGATAMARYLASDTLGRRSG